MHVLAMFLFFALGILALSMIVERALNTSDELRALVFAGVGIALAWAVDFNLWSMWRLHQRADWLGVTLSGLFLAGGAYAWYVVLGFFSGLQRKFHDEAATLEKTEHVQGLATVPLHTRRTG